MSITELLKHHFPGMRVNNKQRREAGKKYKNEGEAKAIEYLQSVASENPPTFEPPAKCRIVSKSRPFSEWPIYKTSEAIQKHVYGLTVEEHKNFDPGTSTESHAQWFKATGVDNFGYTSVQGLNLIFRHAKKIYGGVLKKVENRNKRKADKIKRINKYRLKQGIEEISPEPEEKATDDTGRLLNPPGVNPSIYLYQGVAPITNPKKMDLKSHPGYNRDPDAPIVSPIPRDRRTIPKDLPGHVPEHQWDSLSARKNKRLRLSKKTNSVEHILLVQYKIGEDYVTIDARGLLRNVKWRMRSRRLTNPGIKEVTLNNLLKLFGDPVIDTRRDLMTFSYKADVINISAKKTIKTKDTRETLCRMLQRGPVGLLTIDLGQTNPVAYGIYRVLDGIVPEKVESGSLKDIDPVLLKGIEAYREHYDLLGDTMRKESLSLLSDSQRIEFEEALSMNAEKAKAILTKTLLEKGVQPSFNLPWDRMSANTTYISNLMKEADVPRDQWTFVSSKKRVVIRKDSYWAYFCKPKVSKETREARNEILWELQRSNDSFRRLTIRKRELCRRVVNEVLARAKHLLQCPVAVVIEDLNIKIFHGRGKRGIGWDEFFIPKRENRWFMQALHKAFSDIATHRGTYVFEVSPARTSITCPACGHCDRGNRNPDVREQFVCLSCRRSFNADIHVATHNLAIVAASGKALPKGEMSGGSKKPVTARNRKNTTETQENLMPQDMQATTPV